MNIDLSFFRYIKRIVYLFILLIFSVGYSQCPQSIVFPNSQTDAVAHINSSNYKLGNSVLSLSHQRYGSAGTYTVDIANNHQDAFGIRTQIGSNSSTLNNRVENQLSFSSPVYNLTFDVNDVDDLDVIIIEAYDQNNAIIPMSASRYTLYTGTFVTYNSTNKTFTASSSGSNKNDTEARVSFNFNGLYVSKFIMKYYDGDSDGSVTIANLQSPSLCANADAYTGTSGTAFTTTSVLANDSHLGVAANITNVTVSAVGVLPAGFTLNSNGTITVANTVVGGTYVINYRICSTIQPTNCATSTATITIADNPCGKTDSDGDGVFDSCDLDDDNDGILDTAECAATAGTMVSWFNGNTPQGNFGATLASPYTTTDFTAASIASTDIGSGVTVGWIGSPQYYQTISNVNATTEAEAITNNEYMQYRITVGNSPFVLTQLGWYVIPSSVDGTQYTFSVRMSDNNFSSNRSILGGTSYVPAGGANATANVVSGPIYLDANKTYTFRIYFYNPGGGSSANFGYDDFRLIGYKDCDTDGDFIPNRIDLDSDGDTCPDVIEGGATFLPGATYITGNRINTAVNTSGVPAVPTSTPAVIGYTQAAGQTVNQSQTINPTVVAGTASSNQLISSGDTPSTLSLTGYTGITIQWQVSTDNISFTNITGETAATYSPGALTATTYYRAVVGSAGGCTAISNVVTITVCASGTAAPIINDATNYIAINSAYSIPCGSTTADLSGLTASNKPAPASVILTWHSASPATTANRINPVTAVTGATRKIYAAFYDTTNNCFSGTKEITLYAPICAVDDNYVATPIISGVGGTLPSVLGNDTYNGSIISTLPTGTVNLGYSSWNITYITLNPDGTVEVLPGTPPGTYTYTYEICDNDPDAVVNSSCRYATVTVKVVGNPVCYEDPSLVNGATYPVKHGITILGRAGEDNGNWPMLRNSAYTAIESKTKGFVITRMTSDPALTSADNHISKITAPVIGMMVFDTYEDGGKGCLKINTDGTTTGWKCFNKQSCP
ncbi:hypothetical protein GCM10010992_20070 [Cloacibacterium rupense]|uniref:Uncharacterized protein n=1 Tax=Cloacibacterium rupense TaxID=517423 RepID=A0ABQ2NLR0_9FLAO|nr:hypothetical protein [Cloacibacterium rupense]GGP05124.1 hypothetical protein GCM10010992_20070 [Cloacibacterium rupense]